MDQVAEPDVFTAIVTPVIRAAKVHGASARILSEAFMKAMIPNFGDEDLKETSATLGFLRLLQAEGGSVTAKDAAKLYGGPKDYSEEAVRKAARNGQLLAIRDGNGNLHFPVWQFGPRGGTHPGFKEVLEILLRRPHADDLAAITFFLNPTERLRGISPLESLRRGEAESVRQLAVESSE